MTMRVSISETDAEITILSYLTIIEEPKTVRTVPVTIEPTVSLILIGADSTSDSYGSSFRNHWN